MFNLMKYKIIFVIVYRLFIIRNVDIILLVEKGNIIEKGIYESLME